MGKKSVCLSGLLCLLLYPVVHAQNAASIKEYNKTFTTYPFSDPDPIANPTSHIYPYFRYDGFTDKPVRQEWKVVELENAFIKLTVMPQIGGKIWNATEKSTGKSFIYDNHVIKFRDVAMRGPWTSGGIEANYGIIGHTPNCATPVDYALFTKQDGSVSCLIGVLDLLTGSKWRLEINLQKDKAYFTTRSFWYNETALEQPYYSWMNTALKVKGNLQFIYPGTHYLGHQGEYSDWPVNKQNGKAISFYEQNDFGGYKSYHVFGKYAEFFGAYWHDDDFGMGRYSTHDDKPGKKIWIWGLSGEGMIWKNLLSDTDGQYVEVQSGRLFNQSAEGSTFSPFKHRGFSPYASDSWTEYWFPVKQTRGFVKANPYGALNILNENGWLKIFFSPLQTISDELTVTDGGKIIYSKNLQLSTLQSFRDSIRLESPADHLMVKLGDNKLIYESAPDAEDIHRPLETPADFDWNSVFGLYTQGKEDIRQRFYPAAAEKLKACLEKDPNFLPALVEMGALQYRNMAYEDALTTIKRALSIDTYDAAANFNYGLINLKLGHEVDARDGFDLAAQSTEYRSPAYLELSKAYFRKQDLEKALEYARKSLVYNQDNLDDYRIQALIYRVQNKEARAREVLDKIITLDPLSHFARFEQYLWKASAENEKYFTSAIRDEMPQETFLELSLWYHQLGRNEEALKVLSFSPPSTEVSYWKAFLENKPVNTDHPEMAAALPFRAETAEILDTLIQNNGDWKLKYHLALIWWSRNNTEKAKALFSACGQAPAYAPFYAARAALFPSDAESNLEKAIQLDKQQWRYSKLLTEYYLLQKENEKALAVVGPYYKEHPANYIIGMLYAKTLLLNKQYTTADAVLTKLDVIPFEGATDGRRLYHEAKLMQAVAELKNNQPKKALVFIAAARKWPENLGAGKPYPEDADERLEDWLDYQSFSRLRDKSKAQLALNHILSFAPKKGQATRHGLFSANTLVTAWALEKADRKEEASALLDQWIQSNPGNKTAVWAKQVFESKASPIAAENSKDEVVRILEAYLISLHSIR
jgi:Tfp pilus assembly protein PilF